MAIRNIVLLILTLLMYCQVFSQQIEKREVVLTSLEGVSFKVFVELNSVDDRIKIRLNDKETLCIGEYRGLVDGIKILAGKFMMLRYKVRGGSGTKLQHTVFVCIAQEHLYKALDIISLDSYELTNMYDKEADSLNLYDESGIYKIDVIKLNGNKNESYQLIAREYEKVKSKIDINKNHETTDTISLCWDKKKKVFYSQYEQLNGTYMFNETNSIKTFRKESIPYVKFKKELYFYIENIWYNKIRGNHFVKTSFDCI